MSSHWTSVALPLGEIALTAILMFSGVRTITAARTEHGALAVRLAFSHVPPGAFAIRDVGGLDAYGRPVFFRNRAAGDRFVVFVIRERTELRDVSYWNTVAAKLAAARQTVRVAGICSNPACAQTCSRSAKFMVVAFAESVVMLRARSLDDRAVALEVDDRGRKIKTFKWRGVPAESTLGELERAR